MAFQVSPGVLVQEIDATNVIPAVSSSTGAYVGHFSWGVVDEIRTCTSQKSLVDTFGEPENTNISAEYFYPAAGFLDAGTDLKVVRAPTTGQLNATTGGSAGLLVKHTTHYNENYRLGEANVGSWCARYAGAKGNNLKSYLGNCKDRY